MAGFAHGLGAALMEELAYDARGNFLSGTFADYLCPTAMEVPPVTIGHVETPSPMNAFGAKGMGDGSSMLTPAAIANAVADALGRDDITLPLNLQRVMGAGERHGSPSAARVRRRTATSRIAGQGRRCAGRATVDVLGAARRGVAAADRSERACRDRAGLREPAADRPRSLCRRGDDRRRRHSRRSITAEIELRDKHEPRRCGWSARRRARSASAAGEGIVTLRAGRRRHAAALHLSRRRRRQGRGGRPAHARHRHALC